MGALVYPITSSLRCLTPLLVSPLDDGAHGLKPIGTP